MFSSRTASGPGSKMVLPAALILLISLGGCSKTSPPTGLPAGYSAAADASRGGAAAASGFGSGSFYPLAIGNAWSYAGGGVLRLVSGPGSYLDNYGWAFTESRRLIGTTHHEGTAYTVEEQVHQDVSEYNGPWTFWVPLRQDSHGFFSRDTYLQEPPVLDGNRVASNGAKPGTPPLHLTAFAARHGKDASVERLAARVEKLRELARGFMRGDRNSSTAAAWETQLLGYPLRPGQTWSARMDIPWPVTVDRVEQLETPAGRFQAYRLDINPGGNFVHEGEWVRVWYSRSGYLGYSIHTFVEQTDENGDPTGNTFVVDDSMYVTSVQVAR